MIRHHKTDAVLEIDTAHNTLGISFQHLDDSAFAAPTPVYPHHPGNHAVAIHGLAHLPGRQEQVITALFRHQETKPVGVANNAPAHQVHTVYQAIATFTVT